MGNCAACMTPVLLLTESHGDQGWTRRDLRAINNKGKCSRLRCAVTLALTFTGRDNAADSLDQLEICLERRSNRLQVHTYNLLLLACFQFLENRLHQHKVVSDRPRVETKRLMKLWNFWKFFVGH